MKRIVGLFLLAASVVLAEDRTVIVRPEAIRPADSNEGVEVSVAEAHYEGDRYRLRVSYEGGETTLEWPPDRRVQRGDRLRVCLESSLVVLLPPEAENPSAM